VQRKPLAADLDEILVLNVRGEVLTDLAVDGDAAGQNQFLATATGAETGGGEETIEAHGMGSMAHFRHNAQSGA
jgi:hypothetical protein